MLSSLTSGVCTTSAPAANCTLKALTCTPGATVAALGAYIATTDAAVCTACGTACYACSSATACTTCFEDGKLISDTTKTAYFKNSGANTCGTCSA